MARNGVISLSYARSAGTGDQPVPGTVTSRRNSSRHERQAILRKRQAEEERLRKQKEEQDQIAKILAHKWAEEDRKKGARRRRGDDRPRDDSGDEEGSRHSAKDGEALMGGPGSQAEEEEAGERVAGWVSFERRSGTIGGAPLKEEKEVLQQLEAARSKAGSSASSDSRSSKARRFTEAGGAGCGSGTSAASKASVPLGEFDDEGKSDPGGRVDATKAHSVKVANVFGFGVEEEDDDVARREMELAARSKRAKLSLHADTNKALGDSRGGFRRESSDGSPLPSSSSTTGRRPLDMCQQLMKMAQWKRSCGGKRLPMPKDLEADVAKAMGGLS